MPTSVSLLLFEGEREPEVMLVLSQRGPEDKRCLEADNVGTDPGADNLPSVK